MPFVYMVDGVLERSDARTHALSQMKRGQLQSPEGKIGRRL